MTQLICRIDTKCPDVELLQVKDNSEEIWKSLSLREFYKILQRKVPDEISRGKPRMIDSTEIAACNGKAVFRIPEHKRIVTYAGKAYRINFPNAVYEVSHSETRVIKIKAWTYIRWQGRETVLYLMPMPNMTSSENMCMGSADRKIRKGQLHEALDRILDAAYTHDHVDNVKEQTSTHRWFAYLKKNHVKATDLKKPVCKLSDLVE